MQKISVILLSWLFLLATGCTSEPDFKQISQDQLLNPANHVKIILDVRTPEEYAEGHVPGAINISHDVIDKKINELIKLNGGKNATIAVYCRSGHRAGIALKELQKQGFQDLYHLEGDMNGWYKAKKPVESNK
ncbi:MAG TPA: rhodanese-like domain-containing protein [Aeromonadales bacterium]|nr:rhodanese-like domain-containing protein [Aeromonadales bacterium]